MKRITLFIIFSLFLVTFVSGEYTKETSEELEHLINWQEYTPKTFQKALSEKKPIYLVVSAPSWCYWCHVYESEDYLYNSVLYPYINENFIPVLVDSDKRPDLTRKYLEGGWPATTILAPNMQRINGFTGPRDPKGLQEYLESLIIYLVDKDFSLFENSIEYSKIDVVLPSENNDLRKKYLDLVKKNYDTFYGGFGLGNAPKWREGQKFPRPLTLKLFMEEYEKSGDEIYYDMVLKTFENQFTSDLENYKLYDPVEGGFHRYSTKRDWTIPHYEKMLYDQAKLISVYSKLDVAELVVNKSLDFIFSKFYDSDGGFYSSQDAHLESEYFGEKNRSELEQPFIDKTRKINDNALMIITLIELGYNEEAKKSLDFIKNNMLSDGLFYYYDHELKKPFLDGQSLSNSYGLLAFISAYEKYGEYLDESKQIADYSLDNLYDWNSAGFFERNSKNINFYALNERISLNRNYEENAVFVYGLIKLYLSTNDDKYLDPSLKTLGYLVQNFQFSDESYYVIKSLELVNENNLINKHKTFSRDNFWLNDLLDVKSNTISLDDAPLLKPEFADVSTVILILVSFLVGLLSFLSPCTLPILPVYFAVNINSKKSIKDTLLFVIGVALIFSLFGMGAGFVGSYLKDYRSIVTKIAGLLIILFGILELKGKGFSGFKINKKIENSFLLGLTFGIGWSACIGPILASFLLLASTSGTIFKGTLLLFIYALGLCLPLILISPFFDKFKKTKYWEYLKGREIYGMHSTYLISGLILIILGILIYFDFLFSLNEYALQSEYVQKVIITGEEFLKKVFLR